MIELKLFQVGIDPVGIDLGWNWSVWNLFGLELIWVEIDSGWK